MASPSTKSTNLWTDHTIHKFPLSITSSASVKKDINVFNHKQSLNCKFPTFTFSHVFAFILHYLHCKHAKKASPIRPYFLVHLMPYLDSRNMVTFESISGKRKIKLKNST